ncbi:MAG: 30S ribosomal protein S8 [archaeon]
MTLIDPVADALINIKNHEMASKKECIIRPVNKLLSRILKVLQEKKYIGKFEFIDDGREGMIKVSLLGKINECKAIKPRHAVKKTEFEKYEKRYLPARDIGMIIVSTSKGVITHKEAKQKEVGGRLIALIY